MRKGNKSHPPVHVCSLSMSVLKEVKKELREVEEKYRSMTQEEQTTDVYINDKLNRLRWTNLSMEYNRFSQLQYVYNRLGDKGANPRFRQVKMKPLFNAWKREVLRQKWREARAALDTAGIQKRLSLRKMNFDNQRAQLAAKALSGLDFLNEPPLAGLVELNDDLNNLLSYQSPQSVSLGFFNQGYDFVTTNGVKTFTDIPTSELSADSENNVNEEIRNRLTSRNVSPPEIEEEKIDEKVDAKEEAEKLPEKVENEQQKTGKTNYIPVIIILVLLVLICAVGGYLAFSGKLEELKATPTPTPTPKKGWFGK